MERMKTKFGLSQPPFKLNQNKKFVSIVFSMWLTHVSENHKNYFWTLATTLQIKPKEKCVMT
jgi:hypothetical protein